MAEKTVQLNIRFPAQLMPLLQKLLRETAEREDRSVQSLLRTLIWNGVVESARNAASSSVEVAGERQHEQAEAI